jgi:hypothetical protein
MIESGAGTGAALDGDEWNATRLVERKAARKRIIDECPSFFINVVLHVLLFPGCFT